MTYDGRSKYDRRVAESYDADRADEAHWSAENDFVAAYSRQHRLGRVLDVPVGTGRLLPHLHGADAVVGIDISEDMLRESRKLVARSAMPDVELRVGDALATGFDDDAFDTAVCFRLAHLLPPELLTPLVAELHRVTVGSILLQVYLAREGAVAPAPRRSLVRRVLGAARSRLAPKSPWSHIQSYQHGMPAFTAAAEAAGAQIVAAHDLGDYAGSSVQVLELR